MKIVSMLLAAILSLGALSAQAGPAADQLSVCLTDNTSGKDRKLMAKWIFTAMAAHPEMQSMANITPETLDATLRPLGALYTRLLAESCAEQTRAAVRAEGSVALQSAFEVLGRLAMLELMGNPKVNASIAAIEKYLDRTKLNNAMAAK